MRYVFTLLTFALLACQRLDGPSVPDAAPIEDAARPAGSDVEPDASASMPCTPKKCDEGWRTHCGTVDNCGKPLDCGLCPEPYLCSVEDLQGYDPSPGVCGLNCRVVDIMSKRCRVPYPIEYACPLSEGFQAYMTTEAFWRRYTCDPIRSSADEMFFCCGL